MPPTTEQPPRTERGKFKVLMGSGDGGTTDDVTGADGPLSLFATTFSFS